MSVIPDASVLELYPDEINKLQLIIARVNHKFIGKYNTRENMVAIFTEIEGRCRDELNLEVICDVSDLDLAGDGKTVYSSPTVVPIKRLIPEVFDFARARYETQQGFVDGVPGVIKEDGSWAEPPSAPISMPGAVNVAGD